MLISDSGQNTSSEYCSCLGGYVGEFCQFNRISCNDPNGCKKGNTTCDFCFCYCNFPYYGKNCSLAITCESLDSFCKSSCVDTDKGPKCMDTSTLAVSEEVRVWRFKKSASFKKFNDYTGEQWVKTKTWLDGTKLSLTKTFVTLLHPSVNIDFSCHNHFYIEFDALYQLVEKFLNFIILIFGIFLGVLILIFCCCCCLVKSGQMRFYKMKRNKRNRRW